MSADAERAGIEQMFGKWLEATNQPGEAGAHGYAPFFIEAAVCLPPNSERIDGRMGYNDDRCLAVTFIESQQRCWLKDSIGSVGRSNDMTSSRRIVQ
jgi:hypothetical protein